jgi:tryptophan synthase beta subunit
MESAHAVAAAVSISLAAHPDDLVLVNLSGRGDKDLGIYEEATGAHAMRSAHHAAATDKTKPFRNVGAP